VSILNKQLTASIALHHFIGAAENALPYLRLQYAELNGAWLVTGDAAIAAEANKLLDTILTLEAALKLMKPPRELEQQHNVVEIWRRG
jgi:hypothetical protein